MTEATIKLWAAWGALGELSRHGVRLVGGRLQPIPAQSGFGGRGDGPMEGQGQGQIHGGQGMGPAAPFVLIYDRWKQDSLDESWGVVDGRAPCHRPA